MPKFTITPSVGSAITIEADRAPNEQEAAEIFSQISAPPKQQRNTSELADPRKTTFDQFALKAKLDDEKSTLDKTGDFFSGVGTGILQMGRIGLGAVSETGEAIASGDFNKIAKSLPEGVAKAVFDVGEIGEAIGGRIGDQFVSDDEALRRQFSRFQQDIIDNNRRKEGFLFGQNETLPSLTEASSILLDPTNLIGLGAAGKLTKASKLGRAAQKAGNILDIPSNLTRKALRTGLQAGARGAAKGLAKANKPLRIISKAGDVSADVIGFPRRAVTGLVSKVIGATPDQTGLLLRLTKFGTPLTSGILAKLGIAELGARGVGKLAGIAQDSTTILNLLGDGTRQARFLEAVLLSKKVPDAVKKAVSSAGQGGQRALDIAFNSISNGVSVSVLQGILAKMATDDPEAIGQAVGGGLVFGGAITIGPKARKGVGGLDRVSKLKSKQRRAAREAKQGDTTISPNVISPEAGAVRESRGLQSEQDLFKPTPQRPFATFETSIPEGISHVDSVLTRSERDIKSQIHLKKRAEHEQAIMASKMSNPDKATIAMLTAGLSDIDVRLLDKNTYKQEHVNEFGEGPGGRPFFEDENGTLWVDSSHRNISPALIETFTSRVGKDFIANTPDAVPAIANDFASPTGREFPVDASNPDSLKIKIGGDLLTEINAFNKASSQQNQIIDLNNGVQRYMDVNVDRIFSQTNVEFLRNLGNRPATKQAIRDINHSALGRLGLVDSSSGSPLTGKALPKMPRNIKGNRDISKGVSNLDRLNRNIEATQQAELRAKQRQQAKIDKIQARQNAKIAKELPKAEKIEGDISTRLSKIISIEKKRQSKKAGAQERKDFLLHKKAHSSEISRSKRKKGEASIGLGNEGIKFPNASKRFYKKIGESDGARNMGAIESIIESRDNATIAYVKTAAQKLEARGRKESKIQALKQEYAPFDVQVPKQTAANTTLSSTRAINVDTLRQLAIERGLNINFLMSELASLRSYILGGGKLKDKAIAKNQIVKLIDSVSKDRGLIAQIEPRNIVQITRK